MRKRDEYGNADAAGSCIGCLMVSPLIVIFFILVFYAIPKMLFGG